MQQCIQMQGRSGSRGSMESDTEPLYYINRRNWPRLDKLRSLLSGSASGICVGILTVSALLSIIGLVVKSSEHAFSDNAYPNGIIANTTCGGIYGKIEDSVSVFKHSPTESKAHLLSVSSEPGSPAFRNSDIEEKEYGLVPRPKLCGRRLRSVLAVVFAVVFIISVILAIVVSALLYKDGDNTTTSTPALDDHPAGKTAKILPAVANITCRSLLGVQYDNVFVFKGIPYAKTPNGSLRWDATQPLDPPDQCWGPNTDTWNAEEYGSPCYQYDEASKLWVGSEDCLYLNVWSPEMGEGAKLPVMVYFHGGGLMTGSGNQPGLTPTPEFVKSSKMVYVTFNYRLNVFGFLALEELSWSSKYGVSGNYGILDQVEALRWVNKHIAVFGGDPQMVTVFGEGSGATSIYALLGAKHLAQGLFHRAWLASPSPYMDESALTLALMQNAEFYNTSECASLHSSSAAVDCLRGLDTKQVASMLDWQAWSNPHFRDLPSRSESSTILLITEGDQGHGIKNNPIKSWKTNNFMDVPLLIGSMAQEVDIDPLPVNLASWEWSDYDTYVKSKLKLLYESELDYSIYQDALTHYGHKISPEYQFTSMVSDIRYVQPLHAVSQVAAKVSQSPVYRYVSTFYPPNPVGNNTGRRNYAFAGMDMYAFFGSLNNISSNPKEVTTYSQTLQNRIFDFARTGNIAMWQCQFPDCTILFSSHPDKYEFQETSLGYYYKKEEFDFWRLHGLFPKFAAMN